MLLNISYNSAFVFIQIRKCHCFTIIVIDSLMIINLVHMYSGEGEQGLSWEERLEIALDISHGIEYLHEGV